MSPELEGELSKFLARQKSLEPALQRIVEWQSLHEADHRKADVDRERLKRSTEFRLETLEHFSPRRTVRIVAFLGALLAVLAGYEAGNASARMATAHHLVP